MDWFKIYAIIRIALIILIAVRLVQMLLIKDFINAYILGVAIVLILLQPPVRREK